MEIKVNSCHIIGEHKFIEPGFTQMSADPVQLLLCAVERGEYGRARNVNLQYISIR